MKSVALLILGVTCICFSQNAMMDDDLASLMNLEVETASKHQTAMPEVPASVTVLKRTDIQNMGYTNLPDLLRHVSGIYYIDDYLPMKGGLGVRGAWNDEFNKSIIFLVNGVRQWSIYDYSNMFSSMNIPIEAIERIEIIKGPLAVLYGHGSFMGAIHIFTVPDSENSGRLAIGGNLIGTDWSQSNPLALRVYGGQSYTVGDMKGSTHASLKEGPYLDHSWKDFGLNKPGRSVKAFDETSMHFSSHLDKKGFQIALQYDQDRNKRPVSSEPVEPTATLEQMSFSRFFRASIGFLHNTNIGSFSSRISYGSQTENFNFLIANIPDDIQTQDYNGTQAEIEAQWIHNYGEIFELQAGVDLQQILNYHEQANVPIVGLDHFIRKLLNPIRTKAFYIQTQANILPNLQVLLGGRIEDRTPIRMSSANQLFPSIVFPQDSTRPDPTIDTVVSPAAPLQYIPRAAILWQPSNADAFKFLFGKSVNFPSLSMQSKSSINPSLNPEIMQSLEVNYIRSSSNDYGLSASIFWNDLQDLIARNFSFENGTYISKRQNTGHIQTLGTEASIYWKPPQGYDLNFNIQYQHSSDVENKDRIVSYSPAWLSNLQVGYLYQSWRFGSSLSFVDKMWPHFDRAPQDPTDPDSPPKGYIAKPSSWHIRCDASLLWYDFLMTNLTWSTVVKNVLDSKNEIPRSTYQEWDGNSPDFKMLEQGRTLETTLRYDF